MIMVVAEEGKLCIVFVENIIENGDFDDHKHSVDMRHTGTETTTEDTERKRRHSEENTLLTSTSKLYNTILWSVATGQLDLSTNGDSIYSSRF